MIGVDWKKHLAFALLIGAGASYLLAVDIAQALALTVFCGACALVPDMDCGTSKIRDLMNKLILPIAAIFVYFAYCNGYSCAISELFALRTFAFAGAYTVLFAYFTPRHRGITHSLLFASILCIVAYLVLGEKFALFGALGCVSHLLLDKTLRII